MEKVPFGGKKYLGIAHEKAKSGEMSKIFEVGYEKTKTFIGENSITPTGPVVGVYWDFNMQANEMTAMPGYEVTVDLKIADDSGFTLISLPEGEYLMHEHVGSYDGISGAHDKMMEHVMKNNLNMGKYSIEVYVTDPMSEPDPSRYITRIYYQLA